MYELVEKANEKATAGAMAELKLPRRRKDAARNVRVTMQIQLMVVRLQRRYRKKAEDRRLREEAAAAVAAKKAEMNAAMQSADAAAAAEAAALETETARIMAL